MENFYVIEEQPGADNPAIPTWACREANPAALAPEHGLEVERRDIDAVPGAFQLLNLATADECDRLAGLGESCGYLPDAAVSLGRDIRHNDSFTWIADDETCGLLWDRCRALVGADSSGKPALGLNARFRFYRYREGDYFGPHTDGAWPGSRIVDGRLLDNAWPDRFSQLTFLLFLADGYAGGATRFYLDRRAALRRLEDAQYIDLRTPRGGALCFPHGTHPQHCLHASTAITAGTKYILRSDVLFEL